MKYTTTKTLMAGQPGTKKWLKEYGTKLVCVRYKYEEKRKRKIKTVELVVEDEPWQPDENKMPANKLVYIKINYGELALGKIVRAAGGIWLKDKKLWQLPYSDVKNLDLTNRIVKESKNVQI